MATAKAKVQPARLSQKAASGKMGELMNRKVSQTVQMKEKRNCGAKRN